MNAAAIKLLEWEKQYGMDAVKLAYILGLSDQTIRRAEKGCDLMLDTAESISSITGIPIEDFSLYTNDNKSHPRNTAVQYIGWTDLDGLKALCDHLGIHCDTAFIDNNNKQKIKEKLKKISEVKWIS